MKKGKANQRTLPVYAEAIKTGVIKGLRTALWVFRIVFPIYAIVAIVGHTGFYMWLASWLEPAMRVFSLPGEAVVPLIIGAFSDEYSLVASLGAFSLNAAQITTIAMFSLCCHSLPVEAVISQKIGMPPLRIILFRLGMAVLTGVIIAWLGAVFLGGAAPALASASDISTPATGAGATAQSVFSFDAGWQTILSGIGSGLLNLAIMLLLVLIPMMAVIELMFAYNIVKSMAKKLTPFCRLLGVSRDALIPLLVGLFLGVTYGIGALMELNKEKPLSRKDTLLLGVFLFSCHGIIEGTYLFTMAGANVVFLSAARLLIAIAITALVSRLPFFRKQDV